MNMARIFYWLFLSLSLFSGCITAPGVNGTLGYSQERRVVIVGEKVSPSIAAFYQRKYNAPVWFTPTRGLLKDSAEVVLKGFGPSQAMRSLINELESINYTTGRWEIIVPGLAEGYFLDTLKNMGDGALAHARGDFVLIDSNGNKEVEAQVARVTNESFFVTYEFRKYDI
ncbi:MAG: hypothetical protein KGK03_02295 [Candidatus Omnitrophica bacterium]|nr:hypothetical protein [Candidatus Omnitrophota bacterium]MDE2221880.1 hypothetical protein [Candidatus Omnitrophota bacterium]